MNKFLAGLILIALSSTGAYAADRSLAGRVESQVTSERPQTEQQQEAQSSEEVHIYFDAVEVEADVELAEPQEDIESL